MLVIEHWGRVYITGNPEIDTSRNKETKSTQQDDVYIL